MCFSDSSSTRVVAGERCPVARQVHLVEPRQDQAQVRTQQPLPRTQPVTVRPTKQTRVVSTQRPKPRGADSPFFGMISRIWEDDPEPSSMCQLCRGFPWDALPSEEENALLHHESLEALAASAYECILCMFILWASGCSYQEQGGWVTLKTIKLPHGVDVTAKSTESNNIRSEFFTAQSNGHVVYSKSVRAQPMKPLCLDPFLAVSDPKLVRPWLFGNWWQSAFESNTLPQLVGVGVRLGRGPAICEAEWNTSDTVKLPGSYIRVRTDYDSPVVDWVPGRIRAHDQSSLYAFERLEQMINICKKHRKCGAFAAFQQLPTRVIDVNLDGNPHIISLFESRGSKGQYVALSHCWGTSHRIKTTRANFGSHLQGIALASLSKTFRDAVEISRRLRIRYLWIDSLCIVQDDDADWEKEAASMGLVYSNAYLTISALSSTDDSSGCFANMDTRNKEFYLSCDSRATGRPNLPHALPQRHLIRDPINPECSVYAERFKFGARNLTPGPRGSSMYFTYEWMPSSLRQDKKVYHTSAFGAPFDPIANQPLSTRGWTLQERVLSPRIIHYSNGEIFWECQVGIYAEDGAILERQSVGITDLMRMTPENAHETWQKLVEEYTGRKLTMENDKLPALSGVAKIVASRVGDTYVGGLWRSQIIQGLNWEVLTDEPTHNCYDHDVDLPPPVKHFFGYPSIYRAPSWSWASIEAKIEYHRLRQEDSLAQCIDVQVQPSGHDPFGRISSGWIKLKGFLTKIRPVSHSGTHKDPQRPYTIEVEAESPGGGATFVTATFDSDAVLPCWAIWLDRVTALLLRSNPTKQNTFSRIGRASVSGVGGIQSGPQKAIIIIE